MPGAHITSYEPPDRGEGQDDRAHQRTCRGQPVTVPSPAAGFCPRPGRRPGRCRQPGDRELRCPAVRPVPAPRRDAQPLGQIRGPAAMTPSGAGLQPRSIGNPGGHFMEPTDLAGPPAGQAAGTEQLTLAPSPWNRAGSPLALQAGLPCATCSSAAGPAADDAGAAAARYVYALGRIEARFPNLAAEQEL